MIRRHNQLKMPQFLKTNWFTIVLCFLLMCSMLYIRHLIIVQQDKDYQNIKSEIDKRDEVIYQNISVIDKRLKDNQIKTVADSIAQGEAIKKLGKPYPANLSHTRLLAIRDSLHKVYFK